MADTTPDTTFDPVPMTDGDVSASPEAIGADPAKDGAAGGFTSAKQAFFDKTSELRGQAGDKARSYAEEGKAKASDALGQLSQMLSDAAAQVDEKLGAQYGQYARGAAERVQGFSASIEETSIDDMVEQAREFVRQSPAIAIGAAAAVGFVLARVLGAGLDQRDRG